MRPALSIFLFVACRGDDLPPSFFSRPRRRPFHPYQGLLCSTVRQSWGHFHLTVCSLPLSLGRLLISTQSMSWEDDQRRLRIQHGLCSHLEQHYGCLDCTLYLHAPTYRPLLLWWILPYAAMGDQGRPLYFHLKVSQTDASPCSSPKWLQHYQLGILDVKGMY
jgi:hypothetical protein